MFRILLGVSLGILPLVTMFNNSVYAQGDLEAMQEDALKRTMTFVVVFIGLPVSIAICIGIGVFIYFKKRKRHATLK